MDGHPERDKGRHPPDQNRCSHVKPSHHLETLNHFVHSAVIRDMKFDSRTAAALAKYNGRRASFGEVRKSHG